MSSEPYSSSSSITPGTTTIDGAGGDSVNNNVAVNYSVDFTDHALFDSSFFDETYTYTNNAYSCIVEMHYAHLLCCYLVFLSGLVCLLSRCFPIRHKWIHSWFGRMYILGMLWATCTGILIHETGLPTPILILFTISTICLTIGWIVIIIYKDNVHKRAMEIAFATTATTTTEHSSSSSSTSPPASPTSTCASSESSSSKCSWEDKYLNAKIEVTQYQRTTLISRIFNLKILHGILFFISWYQMMGRVIQSFTSGMHLGHSFNCGTYPVYKPTPSATTVDDDQGDENTTTTAATSSTTLLNITIVPEYAIDYDDKIWAYNEFNWCLQTVAGGVGIAIIVTLFVAFKDLRQLKKQQQQRDEDEEDKKQKNHEEQDDSHEEELMIKQEVEAITARNDDDDTERNNISEMIIHQEVN